MFRRLVLVILLTLIVIAGGTAFAQMAAVQPGHQRLVTLRLKDTPVKSAIEALFGNPPPSYAIEGGVSGEITMSIIDQPFDKALNVLLRTAGLTYRIQNGVYIIGVKKSEEVPFEPPVPVFDSEPEVVEQQKYVRLQLKYIPVEDVVDILGLQQSQRYGGQGSSGGFPGVVGTYGMGTGQYGMPAMYGSQGYGSYGYGSGQYGYPSSGYGYFGQQGYSQGYGTSGYGMSGCGMVPGVRY